MVDVAVPRVKEGMELTPASEEVAALVVLEEASAVMFWRLNIILGWCRRTWAGW